METNFWTIEKVWQVKTAETNPWETYDPLINVKII